LKALIVEDEYLARDELVWLVQTYSQIEVLASVEDGLTAFEFLQQHEVDVVFLDMNMPQKHLISMLLITSSSHSMNNGLFIPCRSSKRISAANNRLWSRWKRQRFLRWRSPRARST